MRLGNFWLILAPALVLSLALAIPAAADAPLDYDVPNGHFFQQANGLGGAGNTGFTVSNDDGIDFWSAFLRYGGVESVGYPVSHRLRYGGFTIQVFQKVVFQWHPETRTVMLANVFDELSLVGKDGWLLDAKSVPKAFDWTIDTGKPWDRVLANHFAILDPYPALKDAYFRGPDPITANGLPMAVQEFANAIVVRGQRKVFQQWKIAVPWAAPGQIAVANGGDVAKEAGIYPLEATTARPYGVNPTPTPTPMPCQPPSIPSFVANPTTVNAGQRVTLSWSSVYNATSASIDNGIGGVATPGSRDIYPNGTTTYTMTAYGQCGTAQSSVTVNVIANPQPAPVPPLVQQVSPANGSVQHATTGVTLTWNPASAAGRSYGYNVEIEQGFGSFWASYANQRGVTGTSFTLTGLPVDFRGHWRVSATDLATGVEGPKSGWWEFSLELLPQ